MHAALKLGWLLLALGAAARADEAHFQRVMAGDRKVGMVEHHRRVADGRVFETERLTLELGKPGRRVTYRVLLETESTADGRLVRAARDSRTREGHSRVEARVTEAGLLVEYGAGKHKQARTLEGAGPLHSEEFSRGWRQAVGSGAVFQQPLAYRTFDPARGAVVDIELSVLPTDTGPYRVRRMTRAAGAESASVQSLDPGGHVIAEGLRIGGLRLTLLGATEAEARAPNQSLDHVVAQFQRSPYRIPQAGLRAKVRYGFDNGGRAPRIPVGGGQRSWTEAQTTWIQVCAECAVDAHALSAEQRSQALAATPWLDHDAPALRARARRVAGGSADPDVVMRRLAAFVRGHMTAEQIDMLGYGSALEALQTRRGDCTEYAVLLAALGRAAGVPTRVVSGLVYSRNFEGQRHVFVPHVWIQAWNGTGWRSFDAALGRFDSTHLALAASLDGNPSELFAGLNLAHELRLTSAARVLPRPEPASD